METPTEGGRPGAAAATDAGPLAGVEVVDFSELAPGPFLTHCMEAMGASIQKVERPPLGDMARRTGPGVFPIINAGKTSSMLDLKSAEGLSRASELIRNADVMVEGFRPGVMGRLGLGYDDVVALNPRLVYVSISGYGASGPMVNDPGHDINYLAVAGVLALSGGLDNPVGPGINLPVGDIAASLYGLGATLAALYEARQTGRGRRIDVSITDCLMHMMNFSLGQFQHSGLATLEEQREFTYSKPGYGTFAGSDGRLIAVAALEDHFWAHLVETLALEPSWATLSLSDRVSRAREVNAAIAEALAQLPSEEAIARLTAAGVPVSAVTLPSELVSHPQAVGRGLVEEVAGQPAIRFPIRLGGDAAGMSSPAGEAEHPAVVR
ncbi:CaiB/BaiF CoA transferase family protein [Georgenia sp. AZ-5]|uniref:CaiB/BaiF CoA transferase family protein n=1 Tax=Georgenia sp. AZ-5 TaxID=3367526 RepID=UPI0037543E92